MGEQAKILTGMWNALSADDKKVYEDKGKDAKEKYGEEMVTYRSSPAYKKYQAAIRVAQARPKPKLKPKAAPKRGAEKAAPKGKAKAKGRAAPKGKAKAKAAAKKDDSDDDVMGSDS